MRVCEEESDGLSSLEILECYFNTVWYPLFAFSGFVRGTRMAPKDKVVC